MKSALTAAALTTLLCLPTVGHADDGSPHPLIGEPPASMHLRTPTGSASPDVPTTAPLTGRIHLQEGLASALIGVTVYDTDQNELGDVNVVLFAGDGRVDTLLIRVSESSEVIGQEVALPFELATIRTDSNGTTVIVVDIDGEEVAGEHSFVGVDEVPPF